MSANYYEVGMRIAEVIAKTSREPLTNNQRLSLMGALGVELDREFRRGQQQAREQAGKE